MDDLQLRKLIECCRPGVSDPADPEFLAFARALEADRVLAERWRAIGRWDDAIERAMTEAPVPLGLAERLMASVLGDEVGETEGEEVGGDGDGVEDGVVERRRSKRWVMMVAGLCAVAATVALVVGLGLWRNPLTARQAADLGRVWIATLDREAWQRTDPPLVAYPLDPSVRFGAIRWQAFQALGDRHATAYVTQLAPDRSAAFLLVVRTDQGSAMPSIPPEVPQSSTEGLCIGTWKSRGFLYVLIVPGPQRQYRRALNSQSFV